jgi:hypothetical protein
MVAIIGRPISLAGRTRRVALAANLEDAIRAADTFAIQKLAPGQLAKGYAGIHTTFNTRPIGFLDCYVQLPGGETHPPPRKDR